MRRIVTIPREHHWNWREYQGEQPANWPREQPQDPEPGQGWLDGETQCLYVWDGRSWVCEPAD